jgi:hypothetical protein
MSDKKIELSRETFLQLLVEIELCHKWWFVLPIPKKLAKYIMRHEVNKAHKKLMTWVKYNDWRIKHKGA